MNQRKPGRPPVDYGKTKQMRVPIGIWQQVREVIEKYKSSFKQEPPTP